MGILSKDYMPVIIKPRGKCSASLVTKKLKIQIKTTVRYHFKSTVMADQKDQQWQVLGRIEEPESLYVAGVNVKCYSCLGIPQKVIYRVGKTRALFKKIRDTKGKLPSSCSILHSHQRRIRIQVPLFSPTLAIVGLFDQPSQWI